MKTHHPIQVRNPTSEQHVVKVLPGQAIHLSLDLEMFQNPCVETDGYVNLLSVEKIGSKNVYYLSFPSNVNNWSEYSHTQLGEVWIISNNIVSKLQIVLETRNPFKQNNLTIINPISSDLRIKPQNIFEVVNFHPAFTGNDEWSWEWRPNFDIDLEEIGVSNLSHYMWNNYYGYMDEDDPDYRYATCSRLETPENNPMFKQHHFWFRLSPEVLSHLDKGTKCIGHLTFSGYPDRFKKWQKGIECHSVSIYVDLSMKYKNKILETLDYKKRSDYSSYTYKTESEVVRTYDTHRSNGTHKPSRHKKQKWYDTGPQRREVNVSKVEVAHIAEGCRVLSLTQYQTASKQVQWWEGNDDV